MNPDSAWIADRVEAALGRRPVRAQRLAGASTGQVLRLDFAAGPPLVAKSGQAALALEAWMLAVLARQSALPVPAVLHAAQDLLLLEFLPGEASPPPAPAQVHAARLLAALHAMPRPAFGFPRDTIIGRLRQPNPWCRDWIGFFRDHRLLHMAEAGHREGTVSAALLGRLERLAGRLERYLTPPAHPALVHGDLWTGNLLWQGGRITGVLDPALCYGHPETDLAYATLFDTLGDPFFAAYRELQPLEPGFFELRRDLYNLYPLLVHVRYWDVAYAARIEPTLTRLGL